jgi:predicted NAD-dependent protein-ADP-ribosyltransferase YbiA (DUF1768 family)
MSDQDVENMRLYLRLKFDKHPDLKTKLLRTNDHILFEDVSGRKGARHRFWGEVRTGDNLDVENMLGQLLMELWEELIRQ